MLEGKDEKEIIGIILVIVVLAIIGAASQAWIEEVRPKLPHNACLPGETENVFQTDKLK